MRGHSYCVIFAGASGERMRLIREQDHIDETGQGKPTIKRATWVAVVGSLAKVAVNYLQTAYAGFTFVLQCEW